MSSRSIRDILREIAGLKVLVVGDLMIDTYIHGQVTRLSPEAPVPVVEVTDKRVSPGGAANVAANIQSLGAHSILCGVIGADDAGHQLFQLIEGTGVRTDGILTCPGRITTEKKRVMSGSKHILRIDEETREPLPADQKQILLKKIRLVLPEVNLVIFEDYDKGCLDAEIIQSTIKMANSLKIPTLADPKKKNFLNYVHCTLFKPNLREIQEGLNVELNGVSLDQLMPIGRQLREQLRLRYVLITLSDKGIFYHSEQEEGILPAHFRAVADVSGAGDTVAAIAGFGLALNLPLPIIAALANVGGSIVCESSGVVPLDPNKFVREVDLKKILDTKGVN